MAPRPYLPIVRMTLGVIVLAIVVGSFYLFWTVFLKSDAPPPVTAPSASAAPSGAAGAASGAPAASGSSIPVPATANGTWKVDTSIGFLSDGSSSFVGYRVREQLVGIGGNTAVGRTPDVSGTLTFEGTTVTAAQVTANLADLTSDDHRRDGQLRVQALETNRFPTATFSLSAPIEVGALPADGATLGATAHGELTLHGVSKLVSIDLKATRQGGMVTVTGSMAIAFADFQIEPPSSFAVLSVEDHGTLELQLHFVHA